MRPSSLRQFLLAVAMVGVLAFASPAWAIEHLKLVIPAARGSAWDLQAREFGKAMLAAGAAKRISYDNRVEGGEAAAKFAGAAKGDASALLVAGPAAIGSAILGRTGTGLAQLAPIARLTTQSPVLLVDAKSLLADVTELMARFRSNPGGIAWGGAEAGSAADLLLRRLAREASVPASQVVSAPLGQPGGGIAVTASQLQAYLSGASSGHGGAASILDRTPAAAAPGAPLAVAIADYPTAIAPVRSRQLRALAIAAEARAGGIPTLKEKGVNVVVSDWCGLFAAPDLPRQSQAALLQAVETAAKHAAWQESLRRQNWSPAWVTAEAFGRFIVQETQQIGEILGASPRARR